LSKTDRRQKPLESANSSIRGGVGNIDQLREITDNKPGRMQQLLNLAGIKPALSIEFAAPSRVPKD
jgi:hypothetical protein